MDWFTSLIRLGMNSVISMCIFKFMIKSITKYLEENKMLPENQHGFRAKRSTMTAWANILYYYFCIFH